MLDIYKQMQKFVNAPPKSKQAKEWVAAELEKKDTLTVSKKDAGASPHPDSKASEEARQLGLDYFGFGRYGKDNKVTHRSVHDKLQPVQAPVAKPANKINEEFENFLTEAVSVTVKGDTPEEVAKVLKLLKDKNGKVRTFMLRRAAAKESHTNGGVVHKMGKGYVIKIKENENVSETIKPIQEEKRTGANTLAERYGSRSATTKGGSNDSGIVKSATSTTCTEEVTSSKTKITIWSRYTPMTFT